MIKKNEKKPRGAGRKPLLEKRKTIGVVLPLTMYNYINEISEKNFISAPEYIRDLIKKDMNIKINKDLD